MGFTWQELSLRVSGKPEVDLALLKQHTRYRENLSPTDPLVINFWEVLSEFTPLEQRLFLRFASGRERPPPPSEFRNQDEMKLGKLTVPDPDHDFPRAATCF